MTYLPSTEVRNEWSYNSIPCVFLACTDITLPLPDKSCFVAGVTIWADNRYQRWAWGDSVWASSSWNGLRQPTGMKTLGTVLPCQSKSYFSVLLCLLFSHLYWCPSLGLLLSLIHINTIKTHVTSSFIFHFSLHNFQGEYRLKMTINTCLFQSSLVYYATSFNVTLLFC
jgi:hypothetical protein